MLTAFNDFRTTLAGCRCLLPGGQITLATAFYNRYYASSRSTISNSRKSSFPSHAPLSFTPFHSLLHFTPLQVPSRHHLHAGIQHSLDFHTVYDISPVRPRIQLRSDIKPTAHCGSAVNSCTNEPENEGGQERSADM